LCQENVSEDDEADEGEKSADEFIGAAVEGHGASLHDHRLCFEESFDHQGRLLG
jgi:hypothetical protein